MGQTVSTEIQRGISDIKSGISREARQIVGRPTYTQPRQPMYEKPRQPTYQQPIQPMYEQPRQPMYEQPRKQVYQPYGQPVYQPYSQPVTERKPTDINVDRDIRELISNINEMNTNYSRKYNLAILDKFVTDIAKNHNDVNNSIDNILGETTTNNLPSQYPVDEIEYDGLINFRNLFSEFIEQRRWEPQQFNYVSGFYKSTIKLDMIDEDIKLYGSVEQLDISITNMSVAKRTYYAMYFLTCLYLYLVNNGRLLKNSKYDCSNKSQTVYIDLYAENIKLPTTLFTFAGIIEKLLVSFSSELSFSYYEGQIVNIFLEFIYPFKQVIDKIGCENSSRFKSRIDTTYANINASDKKQISQIIINPN